MYTTPFWSLLQTSSVAVLKAPPPQALPLLGAVCRVRLRKKTSTQLHVHLLKAPPQPSLTAARRWCSTSMRALSSAPMQSKKLASLQLSRKTPLFRARLVAVLRTL
ncbi:hypothetical protein MRX96_055911 [Rhipicephalus microplus]